NAGHVLVRGGTQVAAEPAKGETEPVIFETEYDLLVVSGKLESLILRDADRDRYVQYDSLIPQSPPGSSGSPTTAEMPARSELMLLPHILYIGFETYPHWPAHNQVHVEFVVEKAESTKLDPRMLQWELCTVGEEKEGIVAVALTPQTDETANLTKS